MIKKKPTFATDFGPIVQWISTFAEASANKGMEVSDESSEGHGPIVQWIEWRFPKP